MAYATIEQLQCGWRTLSENESKRAIELLTRASNFIALTLRNAGIEVNENDNLYMDVLKDITCNLVRRSLGEGVFSTEPSDWNEFDTPTMQEFNPAVQVTDFYLTKWEKKALGIGARVKAVSLK